MTSYQVTREIVLSNGALLPTVGLGTYYLPPKKTAETVTQALTKGYRHIDTAVLYNNEEEVAQGIADWIGLDPQNLRLDVFYTTKLWDMDGGYTAVRREIARCVRKMTAYGLEYIDLLLIHSPLCGSRKRLECWRAMQEAVDAGTVKSIGVSNYGVHHIQELLAWPKLTHKPVVNQIEISPWCMRQELADWCRQQGIVVEAYAPLTHGYKTEDSALKAIAEKHSVSTAQVLIRWSLQHGYVPLPKTQTIGRLSGNVDVYRFELSDEELATIDHPEAHEPTDWECTEAP
ncbi:hypothetical protein BABINDRAFT_160550 [Babjeviella inositovora NRRL Y-12698]|uniref:2-dehydropantolactone reductase n=1 Tax=Babjeviella inositovora NRRL Y-12698 TaxID=984486 RepID=A0A1E3QTY7_9ASCO|nr:uncharacterized protein BABINDRAFT_160550 [Babjeviella inositovora NRRL Y-12698]ODQ81151.1 hypothetical protein BABINDRAFT_160550 [Babjeviella inositovora NRRL Y-12698]